VGLGRGFLCVGRGVGRGEGFSCGAALTAVGGAGGISRTLGEIVGTGVASIRMTMPGVEAAVGLWTGAAICGAVTVDFCVEGATAVSVAIGRAAGFSSIVGTAETAGSGVGDAFGWGFVAVVVGAGRDGLLSSTVGRTEAGADVGDAFGFGFVTVAARAGEAVAAGGAVACGLGWGFGGARPPVRARTTALPASASLKSSYVGSQCFMPGVDSRSFLLFAASSKSAPEECPAAVSFRSFTTWHPMQRLAQSA
jgi:hypothetical protein